MFKTIQVGFYNLLAKHRIFNNILFWVLKSKGFLDIKLDKIIKNYCKTNKDFFFLQIGANDGIKADPLYLYHKKYSWKGLLVEPVPYLFKKLTKNYNGDRGVAFENVAIAEKNGIKYFYRLKQSKDNYLPLWYDEIGSFIKSNVLKYRNKIKDIEKYLIKEKVKCLTFSSLLKKHHVTKIDLLHIDTEGYDYKILKQINFAKLKPAMILYEDRHLTSLEKESAREILLRNGYRLIKLPGDCLAYKK